MLTMPAKLTYDSDLPCPTMSSDCRRIDSHATKEIHESVSTRPQTPRASKKTVRFSKYDQVVQTVHINDLKRATNIQNIWFSNEENKAILSSCNDLVERIEYGFPCNTEHECTRGLERHTSKQKRERQRTIIEAVFAVLDEQDLQRNEGTNDPELLADVYFSCSYKSREAAYKTALRDRQETIALKEK